MPGGRLVFALGMSVFWFTVATGLHLSAPVRWISSAVLLVSLVAVFVPQGQESPAPVHARRDQPG